MKHFFWLLLCLCMVGIVETGYTQNRPKKNIYLVNPGEAYVLDGVVVTKDGQRKKVNITIRAPLSRIQGTVNVNDAVNVNVEPLSNVPTLNNVPNSQIYNELPWTNYDDVNTPVESDTIRRSLY